MTSASNNECIPQTLQAEVRAASCAATDALGRSVTTPVNRFLEPTGTKAYTHQRETLSGSVKLAHNDELRLFSEHGKHKGTFSFTRTLSRKSGKHMETILLRAKARRET